MRYEWEKKALRFRPRGVSWPKRTAGGSRFCGLLRWCDPKRGIGHHFGWFVIPGFKKNGCLNKWIFGGFETHLSALPPASHVSRKEKYPWCKSELHKVILMRRIYIYIYTRIYAYTERERERVMFFALNRPGKKKGKQPYQIVMQWICCVGVNPFGTHKSCGKGHATPIQKTCWKVGQLSFLPLNENKSWSVKKFQSPFLHSFQSSFRIPLNYSLLFILQYHQGQPLHGDSLEDPHVEQEFRVWSFTVCLRYKGLAGDRVWNNWTYRCMKKGMNHEARYQQKNP